MVFRRIGHYFHDLFYWTALRVVVKLAERRKYRSQRHLVGPIKKKQTLFPLRCEVSTLIDCAKSAQKVPGDYAEVGVFEGATAKVIAQLKGDKSLHLFDTFEGLPEVRDYEKKLFKKGGFSARKSIDQLREEFQAHPGVFLYKGMFPQDTGEQVADKTFAFVHLDVDIYDSTLEALRFFYPRLSPGGIILSHDYLIGEGVRKAFHEFFADKPEPVIPGPGTYCLVVKVGPRA